MVFPERAEHAVATQRDRRRSSRLQVLGRLHGHIVALDLPVTVLDIGLGGFAVQTSVSFPVGAVHAFRLTLGDGAVTDVAARVVYSRREESDLATVFVTGFAYLDDQPSSAERATGGLVDKVAGTLPFDVQ